MTRYSFVSIGGEIMNVEDIVFFGDSEMRVSPKGWAEWLFYMDPHRFRGGLSVGASDPRSYINHINQRCSQCFSYLVLHYTYCRSQSLNNYDSYVNYVSSGSVNSFCGRQAYHLYTYIHRRVTLSKGARRFPGFVRPILVKTAELSSSSHV
jgi:hypothetical protein